MTDASTLVATIENRPMRAAPEASGTTRRPVGKAKEAAETEKRTFADSLKDARSRRDGEMTKLSKPAGRRKVKKAGTVAGALKTAVSKVRSGSSGNPAAGAGRTKAALKITNSTEQIVNENPGESEAVEPAEAAVGQESVVPEDQSAIIQAGKAALPQIETRNQSAERSGRSDSGIGTETVSAARAAADDIEDSRMKSAGLSSKSGRVEVVDNRELPKIEGKITSPVGIRDKAAAVRTRAEGSTRGEAVPSTVARGE